MGFALPAALGAKMGAPEREVVAVIGDGGYQMTIQELGTIFQTQAAVKIVVLNNEFLGMVRQWQQLFFDKRYASTEMVNPDFMLTKHDGEICASDMKLVIKIYILSGLALILGSLWKRRGRQAVAVVARIARDRQQRPHRD